MSGKNLKVNLIANTSQFKSAMSQTSNQIKLLNSEFKSAAAETDKYGNKLDSTGAKKKQLNGVIEQYRLRIKAIKNEQKHWTNELKKGNITEEQHSKKQQELARRLNNTEAQMKRYEGQLKRLNTEGKKTTMTFEQFDKKFRNVGRSMRDVGTTVGITAGVGFMAMKRVMTDVVGEAAELEAGMSEVQAVSGATTTEIKKLTDQSKDLGKSTVFTAKQASEAQANLARAGFKVNEIYDAMPGLLDLAASSNMDLGSAANITSNIIRTFGFEANKAGKVSDVLAKGAATAKIDVAGLGESMKTSGPVAKSLGIQFESVAGAAGIMADAGIAGSESGRMLRQGMLRLSKPTGEAEKLIKKLGINVFDADGNMKSLDKVVAELNRGLKGQSKQAKAAALATIFGSESTAGWSVLLDKGSKKLKDYTIELENSEGAAKEMADTMQDNAKGAITRMQSSLSGLKIELGEKLLPTLKDGADWVSNLAEKMSNMDEQTINTIAQTGLLVTAVLGVTTAVATLVAGVGAFMAFAGPVGLAITAGTALVGGLTAAIYKSNKETKKAEEVNLDHAKSLTDQASGLKKSADTFDKLSGKAKISNDELAKMYDLHKRMENAGNKDELAKLRSQYDALAKESGLSKKEIKRLFKANEEIIEQTPDVEQSISEQGNAFAKNTEKVKEYIENLEQMSLTELEQERFKALQNEEKALKNIEGAKQRIAFIDKQHNKLQEISNMSEKEQLDYAKGRLQEIAQEKVKGIESDQKKNALAKEEKILKEIINGELGKASELLTEERKELKGTIEDNEEKLEKLKLVDEQTANIYLQQAGINKKGEEGIIQLEKRISKNNEELSKLDQKLEKNGKLTQEEQKQYDKLVEQNGKLQEAQDYINKELDLYGSVNSLVESKKHLLSEATNEKIKELEKTHEIKSAEGDIINQIQEKQGKLVEEREQLELNRQKQGANKEEIDKQIAAIDTKLAKGDETIVQILDELGILEQVKDGIELNSSELQKFLEGLGYTTEEAGRLAKALVGETIDGMEQGAERAENAGKKTGEAHERGVGSTKGQNKSTAKDVADGTTSELDKGSPKANSSGKNKGDSHAKGLGSTRRLNVQTSAELKNSLLNELGKGDGDANSSGKKKGQAHKRGLDGTKGQNRSSGSALSNTVTNMLGRTTDGGGGRKAGTMFSSGISSRRGSARSSARGVASSGKSGLRINTSSAGTYFVSGFKGAIVSGRGSIWRTAWNLGKNALSALKRSIDSRSPSRETAKLGTFFGQGFNYAIDDSTKEAIKKSKNMGKKSVEALSGELDQHKQNFGKLALSMEQNKQVLKVEHSLDSKFDQFMNLLVNEKVKQDNPIKELLQATLQQNQLLMQLINKDFKAELAFDSVYQPIKRRLNEDQYSNFKQRRR